MGTPGRARYASSVELHKDREKIDKALIKGESQASIAKRFGISKASVQRYMVKKLGPKIASAEARRQLREGDSLLDEVEDIYHRMNRLLKAAEEYLQDPEDPEKLIISPQAGELQIIYHELDKDLGRKVRRKASLQELIDTALGDKNIIALEVKSKITDPRQTMVQGLSVMTKQLELVGKLRGDIQNAVINLTMQPAYNMLVQVVIDATKGHPTVRREIVNAIKSATTDD
jgi:hypothetical protein